MRQQCHRNINECNMNTVKDSLDGNKPKAFIFSYREFMFYMQIIFGIIPLDPYWF